MTGQKGRASQTEVASGSFHAAFTRVFGTPVFQSLRVKFTPKNNMIDGDWYAGSA